MAVTQAQIDTMESKLVELASGGFVEVEIAGRRVKFVDFEKLARLIEYYKGQINSTNYGNPLKFQFTEVSE